MRVLVSVTALLAGLLFATSASTADGTELRSGRRLQLTELIREEQRQVAEQEATAAALRAEVARAAGSAAAGDSRVAAAQRQAAEVETAAGLTAVQGPSLTVSMDDAPTGADEPSDTLDDRPADVPRPDDLVVHQQDVQAVVNALWSGGAEAMTLMGERVVSTSAVRCVGNTLILHGRVYSPPFVITAVGDPAGMRAALDAEPGVRVFLEFVQRFGLGYDVTQADSTVLPAYDGPLELPVSTGG